MIKLKILIIFFKIPSYHFKHPTTKLLSCQFKHPLISFTLLNPRTTVQPSFPFRFQFNTRYKPQRGRRYSELCLYHNAEAQPSVYQGKQIDRSAMLVRDNCEIACRSCVTRRFQHWHLLKAGVCFRKSLA